jgi:hypothetical protein
MEKKNVKPMIQFALIHFALIQFPVNGGLDSHS